MIASPPFKREASLLFELHTSGIQVVHGFMYGSGFRVSGLGNYEDHGFGGVSTLGSPQCAADPDPATHRTESLG